MFLFVPVLVQLIPLASPLFLCSTDSSITLYGATGSKASVLYEAPALYAAIVVIDSVVVREATHKGPDTRRG